MLDRLFYQLISEVLRYIAQVHCTLSLYLHCKFYIPPPWINCMHFYVVERESAQPKLKESFVSCLISLTVNYHQVWSQLNVF